MNTSDQFYAYYCLLVLARRVMNDLDGTRFAELIYQLDSRITRGTKVYQETLVTLGRVQRESA